MEATPRSVPLPARLDPARWAWPMQGREMSLEQLASELERAGRSKRLTLIGGESGIGKTRLASEFAARAHGDDAIVLYGRSSDGPDPPYRPFGEALAHYLEHAPDSALVEDEARQLASVFPELTERAPADREERVAGAEQFVLFGAVAAFLERISRDAPLVLILEDLHWADEGTLLLLRHLIAGPADIRALIVGTYRPAEAAVDGPVAHAFAELSREHACSRLGLEALSREDALLLLTNVAGHGLRGADADLAEALHRESAGNPLFLTELVRALLDAGSIRLEDGKWNIEGDVRDTQLPRTLTELIEHRVTSYGPDVSEALAAASVLGQEFDPELIERAMDRDPGELDDAWDAAERAALLVEADSGRLGFTHPLVARVLYAGLGPRRRGSWHRRIAESLEELGRPVDSPEIARHWADALPPEPARARLWAARAGLYALDRFDGSTAAGWYRRALDLHDRCADPDDRVLCELLIGLGGAQRQLGDPAFRDTLLEASRLADGCGERELLVQAALLNNRGFAGTSGELDEERIAILEAALRATGQDGSRERALLLATLAVELTFSGEWERRVEMSDEAVALARQLEDRAALAYVLTLRFVTIWMPQTLEERLANTAEAVRLADELGDPWLQFHAVHWRAVGLVQSGDLKEAGAANAREQELARRLGDPTTRWISTYDRANFAIIAGRLDEAEALAGEAAEIAADSGQAGTLPMHASQLTNIRYEQGRLPEMQPLIAQVVAEHPGIPAFRSILALAYVEGDLRNEARNLLAIDLKTEFGDMPADVTWLAVHVIYAHVAAELGDRSAAEVLYERLAPWGDQVVYAAISAWGDVDHALGRLATALRRFEDAERHLTAAARRAERIGAPVWIARTHLSTARLLLARDAAGDRAATALLLDEAIVGARRVGAATVERNAVSLREHQRAMDVAAAAGQSGQRLRLHPSAIDSAEPAETEEAEDRSLVARLVQEGDYWVMSHGAGEVRVQDSKGVQYLARLLANPGVEMHAVDLQSGHAAPADGARLAVLHPDLNVRAAGAEDAGEVLDPEAKRRYRARIDELREEIEEADRFNDPERASRARDELEFIGRELAAAVGIGGRDRRAASQAERARVNVTRALRNTIKRIANHDETLGGYLEAAVKTGTFCSYEPPGPDAVAWEVDGQVA
jgi:tetratricopeptide (TPR) repeat protein